MSQPLTDQQLAEHAAASRRGALEGALVSGSVALAGSYYMHRTWPAYRRLPLSLKALGIVIVVAPCLSIQAERRGLEYDRSQWEGETLRVLDERRLQDEQKWQSMPLKEKFADWVTRHQYTVIMGGWATSLGIAGAIISRQKYQTYAQKIVQARMWAQGLTIGLLIVAGALTQAQRKEFAKEQQHDHSWQDILEQQERDRKEAERLGIRIAPTGPHGTREFGARLDRV
ncbi:Respiratory supercomplex factor 2, mitochondrial [Leucoagaricus sp. SymC.cos]|nr:Respiratory supercomplex factor 2, mitochondrial [Leucoagaricus sp. SymC.cos]